ncbi:MAG: T9SS type A sorting domain-containing protein, partial [Candidatus Cloacimonadales bacterium]|nr:T9SS type A sorting domain-containing protein [Candidatus Cloacimonadales bacterium]
INLNYYFDDPDGDVLIYSVEIDEEIADVEIDDSILFITAMGNLNGNTFVTIIADDNVNRNLRDTCETSFNLTINAVNDPPEIISFYPEELSFVITEEQEINFEVVAEDIDSNLQYSWFVNEENMNNPDSIFIYNFTENGEFEVKCIITDEEFILDTIWNVTVNLTGIIDDSILSLSTQLIGSYPNPFKPTTIIEFSIQNKSKVELAIFNITGQKVKQLVSEQLSAGQHSINWNGDDESGKAVSSGIYYYKLNVNGKTEAVKKCLLLK